MSLQGRMLASRALRAAGVGDPIPGVLEPAPSVTNEVWVAGPFVVRVNITPTPGRLRHEAEVVAGLPPEIGYPHVVDYGEDDEAEWLVVRRVLGEVLSKAWPKMREAERRTATEQLGEKLAMLHQVKQSLQPYFVVDGSLELPHQLPADRLYDLLHQATELPFADWKSLWEAAQLLETCESALDKRPPRTLIHGDLHFENVVWDGRAIASILDFEFARPGPPDLDLDILLRFCAHPFLHVAQDYRDETKAEDYRGVPLWLKGAYPKLFAHPRLIDRLTVYALSYDVRDLLLTPPKGPPDTLPTHHPMRRIQQLVKGQGHLHLQLSSFGG